MPGYFNSVLCLCFAYAMPRKTCLCLILVLASISIPKIAIAQNDRTNIMVIMADDLGFSDLGCYGGEIETPNLNQLAENGLRFTRFYNTGRCWPTRASLLTGYYAQPIRRDKLPGVEPSGGSGKRPAWAPLVPVYLKEAGYRSYHTGKWHIDSMPVKAGFDHSYFLGDQARFFSPRRRFLNDRPLKAIERGTGYYATTDLADQAIAVLKDHVRDHPDKPFLHYIALTAPHFPLHALPEDIEKYRERYRVGWDQVRSERWKQIQTLGIVGGELSAIEPETGAPYKRPKDIQAYGPGEVALPAAWDSLTKEQKAFQSTKMAIHAAMVDRIDQELGRVFQQLRDMGQFDNTLILFFSDNGCSSELMIRDDGHDPQASPGSADTHLCLGPGWSTVCNTPFRKHKTWVHEGGIATPLIAHWPNGISGHGDLCKVSGHVIDIVPTVLELANAEVNKSFSGTSLVSALKGTETGHRPYLWWSHENNNAIQVGSWKAVKTAAGAWELYDLARDRCETRNLAESHAGQLEELKTKWQEVQNGFVERANAEQ